MPYNYYRNTFFPLPFHSHTQIYCLATSILASFVQQQKTQDRVRPIALCPYCQTTRYFNNRAPKTAKNDACVTGKFVRYPAQDSWDISVGLLRAGRQRNLGLLPGKSKKFLCPPKSGQIESRARPASCSMRTAGFSDAGRASRALRLSPPSSAEGRGVPPPLPQMA